MSDVGNDAEAGQGGSAGGSSPPEEKAGLIAALQAERGKRHTLETQMAELKGTVDTLKQTQQQPKEHTRAELQAAVDAGQISQVDADRRWDEQRDRKLKAEVKQEVVTESQAERLKEKISAEIERYRAFKPEIMEEGSEARNLVAAEYNRQVAELGKPQNVQTELDALSATFGPASKLQTGRAQAAETHHDVGSDGGETREAVGKAPKGLNADARKYYGDRIERGIYKDWDEVTKELEQASPGSKRRLGVG